MWLYLGSLFLFRGINLDKEGDYWIVKLIWEKWERRGILVVYVVGEDTMEVFSSVKLMLIDRNVGV